MYADLDDLKVYVARTGDDSEDELLVALLERAQRAIEQHTRRVFEAASDTTRYLHPITQVRGRKLLLGRDLASVTSIVNGDGTTVNASQYVPLPRNHEADGEPIYAILLLANAGINWQYGADPDADQIAVTGRWAYSVRAPDDIVEATLELAKFFYDARKADASDLNRPIVTGNDTILAAQWPRTVTDLVKRYVYREYA